LRVTTAAPSSGSGRNQLCNVHSCCQQPVLCWLQDRSCCLGTTNQHTCYGHDAAERTSSKLSCCPAQHASRCCCCCSY
jgi:hypothetical protein